MEYDEIAVCAVPGRRGETKEELKFLCGCRSEWRFRLEVLRAKILLGKGSMCRESLGAMGGLS